MGISLTPLETLRSSSAARIGGAYFLLFLAASALSFAVIYVGAKRASDDRLRTQVAAQTQAVELQTIDTDPETMGAVAAAAGPELVRLFFTTDGQLLAGNAAGIAPFLGWRTFDGSTFHFNDGAKRESDRFLLFGKQAGTYWIVVGEGMYVGEGTLEILLSAFLFGVATILVVGGAGTLLLTARSQHRLTVVGRALTAFSNGDLESCLPVSKRGDDLDRVCLSVNDALVRIETLLQTVRQVSTDIAHDLRSPMTRLRQTLETIVATGSAEQVALVEDAIAQTDGIVATFEALLRISQIESGAGRARFASVDLVAVLDAVADAFSLVAEDDGQTLEFVAPALRPCVWGDRELLSQLFANLVENSIRHGSPGNFISIAISIEGTKVLASVGDTGPGIPVDERTRVLRPFYRLDRSRSTPGTGLGLSIVKAIADLHNAEFRMHEGDPGLVCVVAFDHPPSGAVDPLAQAPQ